MSFRSELKPYQVITNGNMSGDLTSLATIIQKISLVSYTYSWSGTSPVGILRVQVSNDYSIDAQGNVLNAGTWSDVAFVHGAGVPFAGSISVTGNTGSDNAYLTLCGAYAMRTIYTVTSGVGTLQAYICGKVS